MPNRLRLKYLQLVSNLVTLFWKRSCWLWSCYCQFCEQCQLDKPGTALDYTRYLSREKPAHMIWRPLWFVSPFCLLRLSSLLFFFLWRPPCLRPLPSFSHLCPSLQETPNRLCAVKRARWLLTCGAPQNCHSSRVMGRCEYTHRNWVSVSQFFGLDFLFVTFVYMAILSFAMVANQLFFC